MPPPRANAAPVPHLQRTFRQLIESHGGFTVRLPRGEPVSSGISVATRPARSLSFARDQWSDGAVHAWLSEVAAARSWRSRHVGGWLDPVSDRVWLDVVHVVPPALRHLAVVLGRRAGQRCVFDLGRRETVVLR